MLPTSNSLPLPALPPPVVAASGLHVLDLDTAAGQEGLPPGFRRRPYYSVTLLQGPYVLEFEDGEKPVSGHTLLLTSPKMPFGYRATASAPQGASCVFAETFLTQKNCGYQPFDFPAYQPGQQRIYALSPAQASLFDALFAKLMAEEQAGGAFGEQLLRTYLLELLFTAHRLTPTETFGRVSSTAELVACAFVRLLEAQFPIESPHNTLRLKTVRDFAGELALHPNYLNRQVKAVKGRTVSSLLAARLVREAQALLRLTDWHIAEIAGALGFEEPSHFNLFFKKHVHCAPTDYRKQAGAG